MNYGTYGCPVAPPADCATGFELPPATRADCPAAYGTWLSEISDIWITLYQADGLYPKPTDWKDSSDYGEDNTSPWSSGAVIRRLLVVGDKPLPENTTQALARNWEIVTKTTHTLNFDVTDYGVDPLDPCVIPNYDFIRALQARPTVVVWFRTLDDVMVGGADGIACDVVSAGNIFGRGAETLLTGQVALRWDALCDPPVAVDGCVSP